ncbi:hypothetical protein [Methanobrevibacter sp.]
MRRKKDDKRVLRSGNGRQNTSKRKFRRNKNKFNSRPPLPRNQRNRMPKTPRRSSGALMFIVILALVAFVIGAGMGVSLSFDDGSGGGQDHFENVTEEMTKNVNNSSVVFDIETDGIDYNENGSSQLNSQYLKSNEEET